MNSDSDKPVDRRRFFRLGLSELLRPLATAAKPLERMIHQMGKLDQGKAQARGLAAQGKASATSAGVVAQGAVRENVPAERRLRASVPGSGDPVGSCQGGRCAVHRRRFRGLRGLQRIAVHVGLPQRGSATRRPSTTSIWGRRCGIAPAASERGARTARSASTNVRWGRRRSN